MRRRGWRGASLNPPLGKADINRQAKRQDRSKMTPEQTSTIY
jgi:hypothetical protein